MIKETRIPSEKIEHRKFCDICDTEIYIGLACSRAECMYCKKDLCETCIGHEEETGGDYRNVWCEKCWTIGNKYRPIIEALNSQTEHLYEEWQTKCKEVK